MPIDEKLLKDLQDIVDLLYSTASDMEDFIKADDHDIRQLDIWAAEMADSSKMLRKLHKAANR